jgi:hypothetical protein
MTPHEEHVARADAATAGLRLQALTSGCGGNSCPTVYGTDRQTVVVQGYHVVGADVTVPDGEHLVEIPVEVLLAAADKIRGQA